jgi:hypothetical protein
MATVVATTALLRSLEKTRKNEMKLGFQVRAAAAGFVDPTRKDDRPMMING